MASLSSLLRLCLLYILYHSVDCTLANQQNDKSLRRRMQPEAVDVTPERQLEWGQINFIHSTDIHGWYEGHMKERNYRGDWGDYISFIKRMRDKAKKLEVDLLVVDTGDLHDGAGLSDATKLDGQASDPIFELADFDLLAVGNHELSEVGRANATHLGLAKHFGERHLTSNVYLKTKPPVLVGSQSRYFTTKRGLRIMAFGVYADLDPHHDDVEVHFFDQLVQEQWFHDNVTRPEVDLFVVIGHNPVRFDPNYSDNNSTLRNVTEAIQRLRPGIPIQVFGGHSHMRDFMVYNENVTALQSGKYGDTLGWLAMTGIASATYNGSWAPAGVAHPDRPAKIVTTYRSFDTAPGKSNLTYARRYLDWNRETFKFHTHTSEGEEFFDTSKGLYATSKITELRKDYNLSTYYGCAPRSYCISCKPPSDEGNIYTLLQKALETIVVNETRRNIPRLLFANEGGVRYDLAQGPFTSDDKYIVSPFNNTFRYVANVSSHDASQIKSILDDEGKCHHTSLPQKSESLQADDSDWQPTPPHTQTDYSKQSVLSHLSRRANDEATGMLSPGYTTKDDFGDDGDDTRHAEIPVYKQSHSVQGNVTIPGKVSEFYDVVFISHMESEVLKALNCTNPKLRSSEVYTPGRINTVELISLYAKEKWNIPQESCAVGGWIG